MCFDQLNSHTNYYGSRESSMNAERPIWPVMFPNFGQNKQLMDKLYVLNSHIYCTFRQQTVWSGGEEHFVYSFHLFMPQ